MGKPFSISLLVSVSAVLLSLAPLLSAQSKQGTWKPIDNDEGIQTWALEIPGKELPGFRGRTEIAASPEAILRVIEQVEKQTEWMHRCAEARVVRRITPEHAIVYNRTDSPWPVWDRDVVLDTQVSREDDGKRLTLRFHNVKSAKVPERDHTVRMPRLEGSYVLERVAESRTRVTYQIEVDIGGSVPTWIAKRFARDMPHKTLSGLRARVQ